MDYRLNGPQTRSLDPMQTPNHPFIVIKYQGELETIEYIFYYSKKSDELVFYEAPGWGVVQRWTVGGNPSKANLIAFVISESGHGYAEVSFSLSFDGYTEGDGHKIYKLTIIDPATRATREYPFILQPTTDKILHCDECRRFEDEHFQRQNIINAGMLNPSTFVMAHDMSYSSYVNPVTPQVSH